MKRLYLPLFFAAFVGLLLTGCDSGGNDDPSGDATLSGVVVDAQTGDPIVDAVVEVAPVNGGPVRTDVNGAYSLVVEVDSTMDLVVRARATGFSSGQQTVVASADDDIRVPRIRLQQSQDIEEESGTPSNIQFFSQSRDQIGIQGSGAEEVVEITYLVTDSAGAPIDLSEQAMVEFSLGASPDGGEFVAPEAAPTNADGKVSVNVSSGTAAGVVQLLARFTREDGEVVQSRPISIAIHGGLPVQERFSIGPETFNVPGLLTFGLEDNINVILGDRYANPVRPGTAVYFTSSAGVMEGSALTDDLGRASATLLTGRPLPADGVVTVYARTGNENDQTIETRTGVVFSGNPIISVSPTTPAIGQTYTVTLTDRNGNPLAAGQQLSFSANGTRVMVDGDATVTLGETAIQEPQGDTFTQADVLTGAGITQFSFTVVEDDDADKTGTPTLESIKISTSGPNGSGELILSGGSARVSDNGIVEDRGETLRVRFEQD